MAWFLESERRSREFYDAPRTQNVYVTSNQNKNVTVNEHRAPTDESIRIYKEMQEKAVTSIMDSFETSTNNAFKCKAIHYSEFHLLQNTILVEYSLNNVPRTVKHTYNPNRLMDSVGSMSDVLRDLADKISEDITETILRNVMMDVYHEMQFARDRVIENQKKEAQERIGREG